MSNIGPTPILRQSIVSISDRRMSLMDPVTQRITEYELGTDPDTEDTALFGIPQESVEHPVIAGATVKNDIVEVSTSEREAEKRDHSLIKGLGIFAASTYVVTSSVNAFLLHKGVQGPVDTYEMLSQVPGFYKNLFDFIGRLV